MFGGAIKQRVFRVMILEGLYWKGLILRILQYVKISSSVNLAKERGPFKWQHHRISLTD